MGPQSDTLAARGFGGRWNWLVGGAVGGFAGAVLFGVVLWLVEPTIVTEEIPALYGVDWGGPAGWGFHLLHGVVFGSMFGFLVTRAPVLGTLTADVETPFLAAIGPNLRLVAAGLVYGIALWVLVPGVVLTIVVTVGDAPDPLPWASVFNLVGHLLYGMLLGGLVSVFTDLEGEMEEADAPFDEADER